VNERHQFGPVGLDRVDEAFGRNDLSHRCLDPDRLAAGALHDRRHPLAEDALDRDDRAVARLEQVDQAGLHARAAGAGERERQRVRGAKQAPEHLLDLVEQRQERGIQVPDDRLAQGRDDRVRCVAGPGAE
jgi:hypothetical protein